MKPPLTEGEALAGRALAELLAALRDDFQQRYPGFRIVETMCRLDTPAGQTIVIHGQPAFPDRPKLLKGPQP